MYFGAESSGKALTNCWPVHCADGASVTLKCTMRRRSVFEHEEHVQDAKRGCGYDKEVDGNEVLGVVPQKRAPGVRRRLSPNRHVARHRGLCDLEAEHEQLTVNTRRSPHRVLARDSTDKHPDLRIDRWTSGSLPALPGPVELEALAMPADHGLGLHDEEGVLPVWSQTAEGDPECAVSLGQLGAFGLALHNGQLLSQGEVLKRELALRPEARSGGREQDVQHVKHGGRPA